LPQAAGKSEKLTGPGGTFQKRNTDRTHLIGSLLLTHSDASRYGMTEWKRSPE